MRKWLLGRALPDAEPVGAATDGAFVREIDGTTYVCPWRTRLRMLAGLEESDTAMAHATVVFPTPPFPATIVRGRTAGAMTQADDSAARTGVLRTAQQLGIGHPELAAAICAHRHGAGDRIACDVLVLTKPLGLGIISSGIKDAQTSPETTAEAVA